MFAVPGVLRPIGIDLMECCNDKSREEGGTRGGRLSVAQIMGGLFFLGVDYDALQ